jgi:hypothetical protein
MRAIGGFLAVGAAMVLAAGCAPMMNGFAVAPGCGGMQARAYYRPSLYSTHQRVAALQAQYSYRSSAYAGPIRRADGWKSLSSGECR